MPSATGRKEMGGIPADRAPTDALSLDIFTAVGGYEIGFIPLEPTATTHMPIIIRKESGSIPTSWARPDGWLWFPSLTSSVPGNCCYKSWRCIDVVAATGIHLAELVEETAVRLRGYADHYWYAKKTGAFPQVGPAQDR